MGCVYCHKHTSSEHHQRSRALGLCRPSKLPLPPTRNTTALSAKRTPATTWNLSFWAPKDSTVVAMVQSLGGSGFNTPAGRMVTRRVIKLESLTGAKVSGLEYYEEYGPR